MKNSIVKNTSAASLSDAAIVGKKKRGALRDTVLFLIFASLVFLVLYRRFIFGNAVYLYTDIGSDSTASSYTILVMLSRLFQEGNFSFYTLSSGLGSDTTATFLQYINPLKAFLLLFNRSTMPQGILLQLYLEKEGYKIVGAPRAVYIDGIWNQEDADKWLTIIQVPVEKA